MVYKGKLALIGIDGASFNQLKIVQKHIPNIEKMINTGLIGDLQSILPPVTFGAWNSLISGQNPGKHGNLDMFRINKNYELHPYVSPYGYRVYDEFTFPILINYPASYPRQPKKGGFIVHSWLSPNKEKAFPKMAKSLNNYDKYVFGIPKSNRIYRNLLYNKIINDYIEIEKKRMELSIEAINKYEPNFFSVVFNTLDWVFHDISGCISPIQRYYNQIIKMYKTLDLYVGWFKKHFENVIIVSDHGFDKKDCIFYLNSFLRNKGWLNTCKDNSNDIDYSRTAAFSINNYGGIYINDDRFAKCVVNSNERNIIINMIINDLKECNKTYKNRIFKHIYKKNDIYFGKYMTTFPDIIIDWNDNVHGHMNFTKKIVFQDGFNVENLFFNEFIIKYGHKRNGLIIGSGKELPTSEVMNATVYDLVPTILTLFDIAIPKKIDGKKLI